MKKSLLSLSLVAMVLTFSNCGSSETAETAGNSNTQQVASSAPAETKSGSNQPSSTAATVLDPNKIDLSKPIPVADLRDAVYAWDNKEVAVLAHPAFFFDEGSIGKEVEIVSEPGSEKKLFKCTMKQSYDEKFSRQTPIVIKGKLNRDDNFGTLLLLECELVSKGEFTGEKGKASINSIDPGKPIPVAELHDAINSWEGKEVTVTGYWQGITRSKVSSGTVIDVLFSTSDLKEMANCEMKKDPGELGRDTKRNDRVIRGTVKGRSFGRIKLVDCEMIN